MAIVFHMPSGNAQVSRQIQSHACGGYTHAVGPDMLNHHRSWSSALFRTIDAATFGHGSHRSALPRRPSGESTLSSTQHCTMDRKKRIASTTYDSSERYRFQTAWKRSSTTPPVPRCLLFVSIVSPPLPLAVPLYCRGWSISPRYRTTLLEIATCCGN